MGLNKCKVPNMTPVIVATVIIKPCSASPRSLQRNTDY